jgi:tetratricopeptide (TPR) repeat protein
VKKNQLAVPAAIQALKFTKEIEGDHSISMVEPYLHLAQASLGIKQFHKAEEYLSLAQWIVLNKQDCSFRLKSKLHMLIGRTKTSLGQFEEAKAEFAKSILYASKALGADSAITSIGYFRMGDVFLAQTKVESALAFFDKVVDIWFKYLSALHNSLDPVHRTGLGLSDKENARIRTGFPKDPQGRPIDNPDKGHANPAVNAAGLGIGTEYELNEEDLADGRANLEDILDHRRRLLGSTHIATGEVEFTIGLYEYFLLNNVASAEIFLQNAKSVYEVQLGEDHNSTRHVVSVLELIAQNKPYSTF